MGLDEPLVVHSAHLRRVRARCAIRARRARAPGRRDDLDARFRTTVSRDMHERRGAGSLEPRRCFARGSASGDDHAATVTPSTFRRYVVPGRVELVGKHVDYAGGRSLTCAIDLALQVDAETMREPVLRVDAGPERGVVV